MGLSLISSLFGAKAQSLNPLDDRYYERSSSGVLSTAGVRISPDTAMRVSAVYRCVSILANILAMFPKGMYERLERGRKPAPDHPLDPIIGFRPNRRQSAFEFWRQLCHCLVLRQNAFAQIVPGPPGRAWVNQLIPLHPDRVRGPEELPDGRLRYEYTRPDNTKRQMIGGIDIWHLTGLSSDGLRGLSMTDIAADTIGLSMTAERHAARFFERGVKPAGILEHARTLTPATADAMGESFRRKWGGETGVGSVPVLWEGMKFQPVSMNLKDQEFLDSRKFSVSEIARWFGVPPHMIGDVERSTSWGTGIEEQGMGFLIYSLQPWIELLEQSIRFTFVMQPEKFYVKFNVNAILRMDAETQATVFSTLIEKGVLNPNECRELLDRNPREGGDEYVDVAKPAPEPLTPTRSAMPMPDMPPEDDGEDMQAAAAAAAARARAEAHAEHLLEEEGAALTKLARQHGSDPEAWRAAVAGFYGRFARRIAVTGISTLLQARGWCAARREVVLSEGGLHKLNGDHAASNAALIGGLNAQV